MASLAAKDAASLRKQRKRNVKKTWWQRKNGWKPQQDPTLLWLHHHTRKATARAEMLREYDTADRETLRSLCEELDNTATHP
jgi:hypothetical protein